MNNSDNTNPSFEILPFRFSQETDLLVTALAAAQGEFLPIKKTRVNPHFKSTYADLATTIEATRPALVKHGIAIIHLPVFSNGRLTIVARMMHKHQFIECALSLRPEGDTPQKIASTITYGRRYTYEALTGTSSEEDDDGNEASHSTGPSRVDQSPKTFVKPIVPKYDPSSPGSSKVLEKVRERFPERVFEAEYLHRLSHEILRDKEVVPGFLEAGVKELDEKIAKEISEPQNERNLEIEIPF